ncbi:uncharacterized protein LOC121970941 [Zingiber officinale]|uniref:uncharacterized protein LOC121970941 n=1 Tax=Zingiber officinale TaxID=94328 RepID=UPI001C4CEFFD|nr:uncharacterized protein LOC121970941 [Zingiber officinale]
MKYFGSARPLQRDPGRLLLLVLVVAGRDSFPVFPFPACSAVRVLSQVSICFRLATCSGPGFGIGVTEEALIIWGDCGGGGDRVVVATGLGDGGDGFVAGPLSQLTGLGDTRCCRIGVLAGAGTSVADFGNSDSEEVVASVLDGVDGLCHRCCCHKPRRRQTLQHRSRRLHHGCWFRGLIR